MKTTIIITQACILFASVLSAVGATPEISQRLTFDQLAKTTVKTPPSTSLHKAIESTRLPEADANPLPVFPVELQKLDGKRISITGFVTPFTDPDKMTKMMLTKSPVGCFFCNPPEENGVVLVRLAAKEKPVNMDVDTITVEGTLHLVQPDSKDEEAQQFFFTIDEAKVTKSKG